MRIVSLLAIVFAIYGCNHSGKSFDDNAQKNDVLFGTSAADSIEVPVSLDSAESIKLVEEAFYENLRVFDLENGENRLDRFQKLFLKYNITPYQLYQEFTSIEKLADDEGRKVGIEIRSDGKERVTENYHLVYRRISESRLQALYLKYNLDRELLLQFQNNFCFCFQGKSAIYCKDGSCTLVNGKYWN